MYTKKSRDAHLGSLTSDLSCTCCPRSNGINFKTSLARTRASPEQNYTRRLSLSRTFCTKPTLLCFALCQPYVGVVTVLLNLTQSPISYIIILIKFIILFIINI